ncbi:MAG: phosphoenolpyruvate--protein phosphotransferase [Opitutales bacterium]|nr:phosphoenolpyruvate--protein phosphotransferase [Opitutales bacterium]
MDNGAREEIQIRGIAASPGVSHGPAFVFVKKELEIVRFIVAPDKREEQVARFEGALLQTKQQLRTLRCEIEEKLGDKEAQIFDAHQMVLEDRALIDAVEKEIFENGYNIEYAFHTVSNRYVEAFSNIDDDYIKERVADIKDVSRRLLHNLMGRTEMEMEGFTSAHILVSDDVSPSDTVRIDRNRVSAIVTDQGSRTSHAVIMARSINVPAVVGLHDITQRVKHGDILIVDGFEGLVIINPSEQSLFRYGRIRAQKQNAQNLFQSTLHLPALTSDGAEVKMLLNVDGSESADQLLRSGAEGVGLYRTENLFLMGDGLPSEQEQYEHYRRIVETMRPRPVTIRTLDIGGDKQMSGNMLTVDESNPFMGFRAIRLCLEYKDVFKDQLRAILRASAHGNVKIMYPMISSVKELVAANLLLEESKGELRERGQAFDDGVEVGSMIEIPGAAYVADHLAKHCKFFSIGTNDLIQYVLAVDRVNDRVAHLYEPNHPAVMRTLKFIFDAGRKAGIPVSVCGEMAGDPAYAALLFAMGADELSVSAGSLPEIKYFIRNITKKGAVEVMDRVLDMEDPAEISNLLHDFYANNIGEL